MPMAKTGDKGKPSSVPMFHATTAYKLWARARLAAMKKKDKKWTFEYLADQLEKIDANNRATSSSVSQFLGPDGTDPIPSNTTWMPAMNRLLGAAPPPLCDPSNPVKQIQDRIAEKWSKLDKNARDAVLSLLGANEENDETGD